MFLVTLITLLLHSKGWPAWVAHGMAGGWAVGLKVEAFNGRLMRGSTLDSWVSSWTKSIKSHRGTATMPEQRMSHPLAP